MSINTWSMYIIINMQLAVCKLNVSYGLHSQSFQLLIFIVQVCIILWMAVNLTSVALSHVLVSSACYHFPDFNSLHSRSKCLWCILEILCLSLCLFFFNLIINTVMFLEVQHSHHPSGSVHTCTVFLKVHLSSYWH